LIPKFHVAVHTCHATLPIITSKFRPALRWLWLLTLTLGWITLFMGDMGEEALHREDEATVKQRNQIWLWWGPTPRRTGRQTIGRNVIWNWTWVTASSRQRGRPTWKIRKVIVTHINGTSGHLLQKGHQPRRTGRLTVGRNVTSTSTSDLKVTMIEASAVDIGSNTM
jgi:hypothetical protein